MAERARVLVVSDEMEVGGSQRQIAHLLGALDRERWEPALMFFRNRSFLVDRLEASGVPVFHIPKRGRIDLRFIAGFAARLRHERYDIIHCFSLTAEIWVRALLPLLPRTAFIASVRGLCLQYTEGQWRIKRWIVRRADAVISNSRAGAQTTAAHMGLKDLRITLVPNGVEPLPTITPAQRSAGRDAEAFPRDRACGLFVGRLVEVKNVPLLLDALARLAPAERPYLLVVGDGPLGESLRAQRLRLGLDGDVRFLGERADAQHLMQLADFLVICSREEGLSNVVLEAMAAGCPALASAVGGNPELIDDGRTGLLFPSDDVASLAVGLERLGSDAALRARLGAAARDEALQNYTPAELVRRTEAVYARVLADR